jgi:hypothetical protein
LVLKPPIRLWALLVLSAAVSAKAIAGWASDAGGVVVDREQRR